MIPIAIPIATTLGLPVPLMLAAALLEDRTSGLSKSASVVPMDWPRYQPGWNTPASTRASDPLTQVRPLEGGTTRLASWVVVVPCR